MAMANGKNKLAYFGFLALTFCASACAQDEMDRDTVAAEHQVTLMNWTRPEHNKWSFRNVGILPGVMVPRSGQVRDIPRADEPRDIESIGFTFNGAEYTVAAAMAGDEVDGLLVIHNGKRVYEKYFHDFGEHDHHLWASGTKSLVAMAAGILASEGRLDFSQPVTNYLPELQDSVFATASVQQVMDMVTAINYSENYRDMVPGTVNYEYFRRTGLAPAFDLMALDPLKSDTPRGLRDFLPRLGQKKGMAQGEVYEYQSANVDVIGWIIERQSEMPLQSFISQRIWQQLGAEHDAYFATDASFKPIATGGFTSTLRDFARFGLAVLNNGRVGERQVFPADWTATVEKLSQGLKQAANRSIYRDSGSPAYDHQLSGYHNFWWVHDSDRGIFSARGVFGQTLYINREKNLIIANFASAPTASNLRRPSSKVRMAAIQAIADSF